MVFSADLRSGASGMRRSAAYPAGFANHVANQHQRLLARYSVLWAWHQPPWYLQCIYWTNNVSMVKWTIPTCVQKGKKTDRGSLWCWSMMLVIVMILVIRYVLVPQTNFGHHRCVNATCVWIAWARPRSFRWPRPTSGRLHLHPVRLAWDVRVCVHHVVLMHARLAAFPAKPNNFETKSKSGNGTNLDLICQNISQTLWFYMTLKTWLWCID